MSDITQLDRLVAEEPFVRTLAQSLLAGEADEVVQQTYLRALRHSGEDIEQPRSWLATVVRNVASNLQRDEKRRVQRERDARATSLAPSSDELMDREEQRQRLVAAIDALPDQLRTVLLLRFYEGLAPRHIAQKTGLSNDVVRNRIRRALQLLRERLDHEHGGDRRAWMLALVPIACPTAAQTARAAVAGSSTTAITLLLLAAAALLCMIAWPDDPPPGKVETAQVASDPTANLATPSSRDEVREERTQPVAVEASAELAPGSIEVTVLHSDGERAAGTLLYVHRRDSNQRAPLVRKRCDQNGVVRFDDLPAGELWISNDRGTDALRTRLDNGEHKQLTHTLDAGVTVIGTVVDSEGTPVPFARIEGSPLSNSTADAQQLGTSDENGNFEIRDVARRAVIGARARGHLAGVMLSVHGVPGSTVKLQLPVGRGGCDVTGIVRDELGRPVAHASVVIGGGRSSGIRFSGSVHPPMPALAHTDEAGRFEAFGVPTGKLNVAVVARGRAPWQGTCETHPQASNDLQISMLPGAAIAGTVLRSDGTPAAEAIVEIHAVHRFDFQSVRCDENGAFRLDRLTSGTIELRAHENRYGGTIQRVETTAGTTATCTLQLDDGPPPGHAPMPRPPGDPNERIGQPPPRIGTPAKRPGGLVTHLDAPHQPRPERPRQGPKDPRGPRDPLRRDRGRRREGLDEDRFERDRPDKNRPDRRPGRGDPRDRGQATVSGHITGPDGEAVENASVFARFLGRPGRSHVERLTSAEGAFTLRGLSAGRWRIDVFAHALPPISLPEIELGDDEQLTLPPITLPAGGRLRILLPFDYPQHTRIRFTPRPSFRQPAVHHVNGARETDFLPAGDYEMTVHSQGPGRNRRNGNFRNGAIELLRTKVTVVAGKVTDVSFRDQPQGKR